MASELRYVGKPVSRDDAIDKVTGAARYTHDLAVPGMLHAALVTSPLSTVDSAFFIASELASRSVS